MNSAEPPPIAAPALPTIPYDPGPPEVGVLPGESRFEVFPYVPQAFDVLHQPVPVAIDPLPDAQPVPLPVPGCLYAVFNQPAHFPIPAYFPGGLPTVRDAAVVYEGMTLAVYEGGRYEVRFILEAPKTPITIWLQLTLSHSNVPFGTITLPPLTIFPEIDEEPVIPTLDRSERHPSRPWLVRYQGYSHQLRRVHGADPGEFIVGRTGTVRFGTIPK